MAPFYLIFWVLFGTITTIMAVFWALISGVANFIDKKIEDSGKDNK